METFSESQSDRTVLAFRGPEGQAATVIIMRKHGKVWVVLNGSELSTIAMTDAQVPQMSEALRAARRPR